MTTLLEKLKLHELSLVDKGANQHAHVSIFKRADDEDETATSIAKYFINDEGSVTPKSFTQEQLAETKRKNICDARQKLWPLFDALNSSISSIALSSELSQEFKITRINESVNEFLSAVRGEIPDVEEELMKFFDDTTAESLGNPNPDNNGDTHMSDAKTVEGLTKSLDDLTAKLEKANAERDEAIALAKMSDGERSHMEKMSDEDKAEWMKLSPAERKKKMDAVKKNDETVVVDGDEIRKSVVGPEVFDVLKRQSALEERVLKAEAKAETTILEKRAEDELSHLPGDAAPKARFLKALDALDEADLAVATAMLKAADEALAKGFETVGDAGVETVTKAEETLNAKAAEIAKRDGLTEAQAFVKALEENPDLYNEEAE